jgi:vitamin B12 transporter
LQIPKIIKALILLLVFTATISGSDKENVITVSGKRNDSGDNSSTVSTVTAKDIQEKQPVTAGDAIKEMPGVYVSGDGRTGQSQYFFVRGFRSADILVLVDGVKIGNPLSPDGGVDISISPENIARVELYRGPHPVLFGPGAISGVLNIITKRGYGPPKLTTSVSTAVLDMSTDRYIPDTFKSNISLSGGGDNYFYNGGGSFFYTEGISMADSYKGIKENLYEKTPENDSVIKGEAFFGTGADIDKNNQWDFVFRFNKEKKNIDNGPGIGQDDINRYLDSTEALFKTGIESRLDGNKWIMKTDAIFKYSVLDDIDPADPGKVTGDMESSYDSMHTKFSWTNDITPIKWYNLKAGAEISREWGNARYQDSRAGRILDLSFNPSADTNYGIFLFNTFYPFEKLEISGGLRLQGTSYQVRLLDEETDQLKEAENRSHIEPLFSAGISYETPIDSILRLRGARAFSPPTLFQRYSRFADPYNELKPQTAWGFDAGYQQYFLNRKIYFEGIYFYELKNDHIDLDKSGKFSNRYQIENHGMELILATKPFFGFSIKSAYTWIFKMEEYKKVEYQGKMYRQKTPVLRRPAHSFNTVLNYNWKKKLNISLSMNYVGKRNDEVFNYPKTPYMIEADHFFLMDLAITYKINKHLTMLAKIENMLDNDDYAYSVEYGTAGITPWLGLKFNIGGI